MATTLSAGGSQSKDILYSSPRLTIFMDILNTITQFAIGGCVLAAFGFAIQYDGPDIIDNVFNSSLSLHIILCVTGYVIFISQAVLLLSPHTGWSRSLSLKRKRVLHFVMQVVGAALALIGSSVRIADKKNHFTHTHGSFGIIALVCTLISMVGGLGHLFMNRLYVTRVIHCLFGVFTIVAAYAALSCGYTYFMFSSVFGTDTEKLGIVFACIATAGIVITAGMNTFRRR